MTTRRTIATYIYYFHDNAKAAKDGIYMSYVRLNILYLKPRFVNHTVQIQNVYLGNAVFRANNRNY